MGYNLARVIFTSYGVNYDGGVAMIGAGRGVFNPFGVDPSLSTLRSVLSVAEMDLCVSVPLWTVIDEDLPTSVWF